MKYEEWLDFWLLHYIKPSAKARTYECYRRIVDGRLKSALGESEVSELSPMRVQAYVTQLLRGGNLVSGAPLAASTVNLVITVLQGSLRTAYLLGETEEYIGDKIKRPRPSGAGMSCFSLTEQRRIECAVLSSHRLRLFGVVLCLYTGLRIGELLALRWENVDFQKRMLYVNKTCRDTRNTEGVRRLLGEPKTEASKREIPFSSRLLPYMLRLREGGMPEDFVILEKGKPPTLRSYQRYFATLLRRLAIPHRGFHALRHTFATRALENGMDVKTLSELLGHASATVTLHRYAHSFMEHKKEMMEKLGTQLSPPTLPAEREKREKERS